MNFAAFVNKIYKINVDRSKGAPAPHKAILLLSVLQCIGSGEISENKIYITPELVARFKNNWHSFVHDERFSPNFSLPFYHLKSSNFWFLKTYAGKEVVLTSSYSISSFSALKNTVAYAYFDNEVYEALKEKSNRDIVAEILISTYLHGQQPVEKTYDTFDSIETKILNEPPSVYKKEIAVSDDEEIFIRGGVFKKVIPKAYNYTCAISGMKIITTRDVQMIDACHIVPFSESHDDTITNGISLSPNFHRAFDRFLITIDESYRVVVSNQFVESGGHSIKLFEGGIIHLPEERKYYPSLENLHWHREKFIELHSS